MKLLFTFLAVLFLSTAALAQENKVYEYLTMIHQGHDLKIGYGNGEFEVINIKEERSRDASDHRPLLKRISEFESDGWELVSTELYRGTGVDIMMYALLRKEI